jgi:two-component system cell cycle response regulator DivK
MMNDRNKTILLVDDDPRNIFALSAVLRSRGYTVLTASSAQEGIQLLRKEESIVVVLLDMMMPDMDGYEALRFIKKDEALAHIPVFAVTAQAMVGDRERCLEAGADGYISKPVDVDILFDLLKEHWPG